MPVLI